MANGTTALANPMTAVTSTYKVLDQHGKVVHASSKTFFSAFREAKEAYRAKKAEIAAERALERRARERIRRRHTDGGRHSRSAIEDGPASSQALVKHKKKHRSDSNKHSSSGSSSDGQVSEDELDPPSPNALIRRHTMDVPDNVNENVMGMAPALLNDPSVQLVSNLLTTIQSVLDEIVCVTAGLTTLIQELQRRPDMIAGVAFSLAEIAQAVTKVSPVALPVLKATFPTVFALLSSPHFAVVAGIGTAATVVVLGGYKIVRSIIAGAEENRKMAEDDGMAYGEGAILGEVEDDPVEAPPPRRPEPIQEMPPPPPPPKPHRERKEQKLLTASAHSSSPEPEPMAFDLTQEKRKRKQEKEKEKNRHKEDKERKRERKDKKEGGKEKERRYSSHRAGSTVGSVVSTSSKEEKEKEKEKKRPGLQKMRSLFEGKSK